MTVRHSTLGLAATLALLSSVPAWADSFTSSASSAGSASVGSISDSIQGSSRSSSGDDQTAQGDYRVIEIADAAERPGQRRLRLEPVGGETPAAQARTGFDLLLPAQALAAQPIAVGDIVRAEARPYGLAFVRATAAEPFFLVLDDARHRELQTRVVTL